jgi:hypothetical protein
MGTSGTEGCDRSRPVAFKTRRRGGEDGREEWLTRPPIPTTFISCHRVRARPAP